MFGYRFGMSIFFNQIWIVIFISVLVSVKLFFKLTSARCNSKVTLLGKTALVTGGSSGIGYQIATELASRGCTVILAQNIVDDKIRKTLVEKTNNPHIFLEYVDLSSFESVRKLVERLKKTLTKLDILINNAGIGLVPEVLTEDGLMLTWQVNYYSSFLLTYLLLDLMKNSEAGRIIFTSSLTSHFHTTHIKYIRNNKIECTTGIFNYFNTKFLLILAADYFAKKLRKFNITSNSYHPGIVMTPIYGDSFKNCRSILDYVFLQLILIGNFFAGKSLEEGVQTVLHLAVAKEVANVTGEFFGETTKSFKPRGANNKEFCEKIWKATECAVGLKPEEILGQSESEE